MVRRVDERRRDQVDYEGTPLTRQEYISAIVHLYRGELSRATAWRIRLDTTTNWAVLTTAGLLAFAFRSGDNPHWPLLLGTALISLLLGYEARRYQMFDVWRSRVRKIEENFYGPILTRDPVSPYRQWGERVARDLLTPSYKIGFRQAVRARFLRNYWAIYVVLLAAWAVKVLIHPNPAKHWDEVLRNLAGEDEMLSYHVPLIYMGVMVLAALYLLFGVKRAPEGDDVFWREDRDGEGHVPDA
jgi:uncharacterized membrane protein